MAIGGLWHRDLGGAFQDHPLQAAIGGLWINDLGAASQDHPL